MPEWRRITKRPQGLGRTSDKQDGGRNKNDGEKILKGNGYESYKQG